MKILITCRSIDASRSILSIVDRMYMLLCPEDIIIIRSIYSTSVATWSGVKESLLVSFSKSTTSTVGVAARVCDTLTEIILT